ncbi:hypothetical protein FOL47_008058 [Perkinsus chesapeaki]|uniref:RING-type E3 ubiquitin transferase n=1 Tax=Perkinsus chesapeaki TaxID=330153 RepID=A0A7J6N2Q7_PERCH|nr:hypothetical protein FOL47_008058 [Perkinsus chesapeaki]
MTISFRLSKIHPAFQRKYLGMWLGWLVAFPCAAIGIVMTAPSQGYVFLVYVILCGIVPPLLIMQYAHNIEARERRLRALEGLHRRSTRSRLDVTDNEMAALRKEWNEWMKEECQDLHGSDLKRDEEPCAICLTDYTPDDEIVKLPCGHEYHTDCLHLMFNSFPRNGTLYHTCPLCRVQIGHLERTKSDGSKNIDVPVTLPVSS